MQINEKAMAARALEGGFADPVFDAQNVFNAVMNAMARPGTVTSLPALASAPEPVFDTAAAIIAALCDADTLLWLDEVSSQSSALRDWITFQTAAPITTQKADAQFALLTDTKMPLDIAQFAQGSQEYPDRSCTLIIQVDDISKAAGLSLSGPGIKDTADLHVQGLPELFLEQWQQNKSRFPCGVDVILVSASSLVCLPRTTNISQGVI
ncbi:phosphonate C-P lyase system protein PhnH [Ahrensia kielensis]|uniref:phosphonate C-P lyase system protein PhnH n=1 Tax=Ahrensia kielensis TaxID=76980 RepID=UPI000369F9DB|nr:phosphonate C-P lyase system protein PhnH [Ahrensia kielensis]